jgi:hypothetical protein
LNGRYSSNIVRFVTVDIAERRKTISDHALAHRESLIGAHVAQGGDALDWTIDLAVLAVVADRYVALLDWYKSNHRYLPGHGRSSTLRKAKRVNCDKVAALTALAILEMRPFRCAGGRATTPIALDSNSWLAIKCMQTILHIVPKDLPNGIVEHLLTTFRAIERVPPEEVVTDTQIDSIATVAALLHKKYGHKEWMQYED